MTKIAKMTRTISIGSTVMCQSVIILYFISRIILYRYTGRNQFVPGYYPCDVMITPNLELTNIGQLMGSLYSATSYAAVDSFVAMLLFLVCSQFTNLRHELCNICSKGESKFNRMLLMQMIGCTLQLFVQSFQAILDNDGLYFFQMIFLVYYICYILLQIHLYCYIGERLLTESTEIAYAAYSCEWYNIPAKEVKYLVLIMRRARSPLRIRAGQFCSFNHELISDILKTSLDYLSILYNMKSKND